MSTIDKMSIQGIRSFDPENKQVIQFYNPLTLILGPNGTGKTTIIECLKYITTGAMPPGAKIGGAFIHDPKIAGEREVKGQVKLKFRDISRQVLVVERSMTATQRPKKIESKTLDGVITRIDAEGKKQSINSKCTDLDLMMITSLGVSKPVLENVIFCHQEDANWPLGEGKQVKEKFDAIFASTRYVKALENIKKIKKEKDTELARHRQDIQYLKQHKDKAHEYQCDLSEQEAKLAASRESVQKVKNQLQPIQDKLDKIDKQSADIYEIENEKTMLKSEKKQIGKSIDELQENIHNEFQGSDQALKRMLAEFQDKLEERKRTLAEHENRQKDLGRQSDKLGKDKSVVLVEVGRLEQEAERHSKNIKERDDYIRRYAEEYEFEGLGGAISDDKYKLFLQNIQSKLQTMVSSTKELKEDYEAKEKGIQAKIDELRDTKTKLEQSQKMKEKMISDNDQKVRDIKKKLSEIETSSGRLDQLKRELKRSEHDLQTVETSVNTDELKEEIESLKKKKTALDSQISELSSEMNRLTLQSSAQAQLDVLKKDKTTKEDNINRLKAKLEDTVKHILGHMPSRNVRGELEDYISKQSHEVKKCSTELNKCQNNLSKLEMERKMKMEQLKQKENELKGLEERVYTVCGSQNFDEGLSNIQEKMDKTRDQRGSLLGARHFFQKYVEGLEKESPCCPLCHRAFDQDQEARDLVFELKEKLRMVPSKLERAEKDIDQFQEKYDELMQLKPLREKMESLETTDIPTLKTSLKRNQDSIQKLREEISELEGDLQIKESDESVAKDMKPDIVMMDKYYGDINELDKKISVQAAKLTGGDTGRTLQMVIDEKEDLQMKVDTIAKKIDYNRQKLSDFSDKVQTLRGEVNSLREEKLRIENDIQQRLKLEEDKANLETENQTHTQEIKESRRQLRPLQEKMDKLREDKDKIVQDKETKIEEAKAEVEAVKRNGTDVKNINQEIRGYNQSGKADDLTQNKARKEKLESKLEKIEKEAKEVADSIDKLRKDLATQEVRELDLNNNMTLRNKQKEVDDLSDRIKELEGKLEGLDVAHLSRDRQRLQNEIEKLTRERHTAEGRQRGFEDQIITIKKELRSDMYKDAEAKYRNKVIELRTTELANKDLEKYYYALDKAIMNYHNIKMEEINKIIRELWRNTYRGHDIETIEIRSDEDESGTIKTRKVYNYRVVMIKPGDTVIDMRARCSAGQKVLASLIIRLALAETFCLNCGILALDEPTTNLDRENIESLASALVEIIKGRAHQRNFQLVVITHDEDFVELLGRSEYVEEFFKVNKAPNGCSQLTRANVQDLHSR